MSARPLAALLLLAGGCHLLIGHRSADDAAPADGARDRAPLDARVDRTGERRGDARGADAVWLDLEVLGDVGAKPDQAGKDVGAKDQGLDKDGGSGNPLQPVCDPSGWCWDHPVPQGNTLYGVWGTSASDLYAVGDGRSILRWNGVSWSRMATAKAAQTFHAVFGVGGKVFAGGTNGTLLELSGTAWTDSDPTSLAGTNTIRALWGASTTNVYAVGGGGMVLRLGGGGWSKIAHGLTTQHLYAIWGSGANDLYVGGEGGTLLHWDGLKWESYATGSALSINAIGGTGPSDVYVGTPLGVHKVTAKAIGPALQSFSVNAIFAQGSTLVAVGELGKMAVKSGASWGAVTAIGSAQGRNLHAGWGSGSDRVLVGHAGTIVRQSGTTYFNVYQARRTEVLRGVWRSSSGELYVVGGQSQGFLLKRDANGVWSEIGLGSVPPLHAIWGKSSGLYLVGDKGTAIFYNWSAPANLNIQTTADLRGVWCPESSAQAYFVGKGGLAKKLDGSNWSTLNLVVSVDLYAVWGRDAATLYIAGDSTAAFLYNGSQAQVIPAVGVTASLRGVWADSSGNAYFVGSGGTILRWPGTGNAVLVASGTPQTLNAVTGDPATKIVHAVGNLGAYVIGAGSFSSIPTPFGGHLHAVATGGNGTFALGVDGAVLRR